MKLKLKSRERKKLQVSYYKHMENQEIENYKAELSKITDPIERREKKRHFRIWIKRLARNPNRRELQATHEVLRTSVTVKDKNGKEKAVELSTIVAKDKNKYVSK